MRAFSLSLAAASAALFIAPSALFAQQQEMRDRLDSAIVASSRAGGNTPVTYTEVSLEELRSASPSVSLPQLLGVQPSVVTSCEGGTGLGYTKLSVRGSKGSQINVTLNGITLNDAESQEVFWVNIPSLTSIVTSVQLQRGLGTSSNGSGAFGASINMSTASVGDAPTGRFVLGTGSFGTTVATASFSTGLTASGLYFSGAYSRGVTDGYIRNAYADVQSAFGVLGYLHGNNSLRFTYLIGDQHTGITWEGIPASVMDTDRRYNPAGEYHDSFGNVRYYDNETDNYNQQHFQLNYTHSFTPALSWSTTLNYTRGKGYYEQYKADAKLTKYGFDSPWTAPDGESYKRGDFIIRKRMDNGYAVLSSNLGYSTDGLELKGGVYLSNYDGDHFGDVVWSNVLGDGYDYSDTRWYLNNGLKKDLSAFIRGEKLLGGRTVAWLDLQYRGVLLDMTGDDDNFLPMDYSHDWHFFNPKGGVTLMFSPASKLYASVALGHREPGRSDMKNEIESVNILIAAGATDASVKLKDESMVDVEAGWVFSRKGFSLNTNIYLMEYKDMLLETGKLSETGYALKENVPRSWRRGFEAALAWQPAPVFHTKWNITLSTNKIKDYTFYREHYDDADNWNPLPQIEEHFGKTTMLMSPSVVSALELDFRPFALCASPAVKELSLDLDGKFVGRQYWDNTSCRDRSVPAYFVAGLCISDRLPLRQGGFEVALHVSNLLNRKYYSDAWVYRPYFDREGDSMQEEGLFPQAPLNCMLSVAYSF